MFTAEAAGLEAIRNSASLRAPQPVCHAADGQRSWLAMEYIEFGTSGPRTSTQLGEQRDMVSWASGPASPCS